MVTDCNYRESELDRRIVYEMIGERLRENEFQDETTESEEPPDIHDSESGDEEDDHSLQAIKS